MDRYGMQPFLSWYKSDNLATLFEMKPFENNDFTYSWKWWDPKQPTGLYPIMHWAEGRRHPGKDASPL